MWSGALAIPSSPDDRPNIVLTGFMGAGKTTVGTRIAALLKRPFVDTDLEISARAGKSIPRIFAEDGESAFRALEAALAIELGERRGLVIATGGGMLINPANLAVLAASGIVVCLDTPPDVLEKRLKRASDRPLAANWRELYTARQAAYAAIPLHINTAHKAADTAAREIIALWQNVSR